MADGTVNGWLWLSGSEPLMVTRHPVLEIDGGQLQAGDVDCRAAASCLADHPELSGKLATVIGTPAGDRLAGTAGRDLLVGLGGDDVLRGGAGADLLCGGMGGDLLRGNDGGDIMIGGDGDDLMFGGRGSDVLIAGAGNDSVYGQAGADQIVGGSDDDTCFGGGGPDALSTCRVAVESTPRYGGTNPLEFNVVVEDGLEVGRAEVVAEVDRILADDRSWIADGITGFRRVGHEGDFTVTVASPSTVDRMCAPLGTGGYLSCRNRSNVILNADRWTGATEWWPAGIGTYREYLVNHEVGHLLGHGHVACPGSGETAPVMMQQTKGLDDCVANGWPYAEVAAG